MKESATTSLVWKHDNVKKRSSWGTAAVCQGVTPWKIASGSEPQCRSSLKNANTCDMRPVDLW